MRRSVEQRQAASTELFLVARMVSCSDQCVQGKVGWIECSPVRIVSSPSRAHRAQAEGRYQRTTWFQETLTGIYATSSFGGIFFPLTCIDNNDWFRV